mmetsp:Transcript_26989/g.47641  ORF Transcript_26989/g.47641 Transcript_26989/m.47641 type:complete len:345 (-) Transcript_26989:1223-2257(-)
MEDTLRRVEELLQQEKLLEAARLLRDMPVSSSSLSESHRKVVQKAEIIEHAVADLLSSPQDDWKRQGGQSGDFTVYYKVDDGARLTCRIESPIPASLLVPLLSVLNESSLYQTWIPFFHRPFHMGVSSSKQLLNDSRGHQVIQVQCQVPWPMKPREALFDVAAVDDIDEHQFIIAKMTTINNETAQFLLDDNTFQVPECPPGMERCDFDGAVLFRACPPEHNNFQTVKQKHPTEDLFLVQFLFYFDAKMPLIPQALINFVTREAIGIIWKMLLSVAEDVRNGKRKEHCDVIAQKREFYEDWVARRCEFMLRKIKDKNQRTKRSCRQQQSKNEHWTVDEILRMNM